MSDCRHGSQSCTLPSIGSFARRPCNQPGYLAPVGWAWWQSVLTNVLTPLSFGSP
jgi:hypothetical protein